MKLAGRILSIVMTVAAIALTVVFVVIAFNAMNAAASRGDDGYQEGDITASIFGTLGAVMVYFLSGLTGIYSIMGIVFSIIAFTKLSIIKEKVLGIVMIVSLLFLIPGILFLIDCKKSNKVITENAN